VKSRSELQLRKTLCCSLLVLIVLTSLPPTPVVRVEASPGWQGSTFNEAGSFRAPQPIISTVAQIGDRILPKLSITDYGYEYETVHGLYKMDAKELYIMRFFSLAGKLLIARSAFWIQVQTAGAPLNLKVRAQNIRNVSVIVANNECFRVSYLIVDNKETLVGNMTVTWRFFSDRNPKIDIWFFRDEKIWQANDWRAFNVLWSLVPEGKYVKLDYIESDFSGAMDKTKLKTVIGDGPGYLKKLSVCSSLDLEAWISPLEILWSDFYGDVSILYGKEPCWDKNGVVIEFQANVPFIDPTVICTSTSELATGLVTQIKIGYCGIYGRWYVIYTDGTYYRYRHSKTGLNGNWSDAVSCTTRDSGSTAVYDSMYLNGSLMHYVISGKEYVSKATDYPYYKQGTIQSDGSISWGTEYNVPFDALSVYHLSTLIQTNSTGYPMYVERRDDGGTRFRIKAGKSNTLNGSGTWTYYSVADSAGAGSSFAQPVYPTLVALQDGDMYVTYHWTLQNQKFVGRFFDGATDAFSSEETIRNSAVTDVGFNAVSNGTHIFCVVIDKNDGNMYFYIRGPAGWSSGTVVWTGLGGSDFPALSLHNSTSNLYIFLVDDNHIYYRIRYSNGDLSNIIDWVDDSVNTIKQPSMFTAMPLFNSLNQTAVLWTSKAASPFDVKFAMLDFSPSVSDVEASNYYVSVESPFLINSTVSHANGYDKTANLTLTLTDGTVLRWVHSTNTFSIPTNPTGTFFLLSGTKTYVGAQSVRVSWQVRISGPHEVGSVGCTEAKAYDIYGYSGNATAASLFYLKQTVGWLANYEGMRRQQAVKLTSGAGTDYVVKFTVYKSGYKWKTLADALYGRLYAEVVYSPKAEALYFMGGRACSNDPDSGTRYNYVEKYDPVTNTWTRKADMPVTEDAAVAVAYGDFIYVAGGYPSGTKVYRYNVTSNTWDDTPTDLPANRWDVGGVLLDNWFYVLGGSSDANAYKTCWRLDLNNPTSAWETKTEMTYEHAKFGSSVHNGMIYVFGSAWTIFNKKVERYNSTSNTWTTLNDLPWATNKSAISASKFSMPDGYIYLYSDWISPASGEESLYGFYRYNPTTDTYHQLENVYTRPEGWSRGFYLANKTVGNDFFLFDCGGGGSEILGTEYKQKTLNVYGPLNSSFALSNWLKDPSDIRIPNCQDDFSDIVFTAGDGQTVLPYAIERKINGNWSLFAVKITGNLSVSDQTLYVYYGDASHSYSQNKTSTYLWYDDFTDLSKWDLSAGTAGDVIEAREGQMRIYLDGVSPNKAGTSKPAITTINFTVEYDLKVHSNSAGGGFALGITDVSQADDEVFLPVFQDSDHNVDLYRRATGGWTVLQDNVARFDDGCFRISHKIIKLGSSFGYYRTHPYQTRQLGNNVTCTFTGNSFYLIVPRAWQESTTWTGNCSIDNIRVRKACAIEPTLVGWSTEEETLTYYISEYSIRIQNRILYARVLTSVGSPAANVNVTYTSDPSLGLLGDKTALSNSSGWATFNMAPWTHDFNWETVVYVTGRSPSASGKAVPLCKEVGFFIKAPTTQRVSSAEGTPLQYNETTQILLFYTYDYTAQGLVNYEIYATDSPSAVELDDVQTSNWTYSSPVLTLNIDVSVSPTFTKVELLGVQNPPPSSENAAPTIDSYSIGNSKFVINSLNYFIVIVTDTDGVSDIKNVTLGVYDTNSPPWNTPNVIQFAWTSTAGFYVSSNPYALGKMWPELCALTQVDADTHQLKFVVTVTSIWNKNSWLEVLWTVTDASDESDTAQLTDYAYVYQEEDQSGSPSGTPLIPPTSPEQVFEPLPPIDTTSSGSFASSLGNYLDIALNNLRKAGPVIVRPFIQAHGAEIIIFLLLFAWLVHELRKEGKADIGSKLDWKKLRDSTNITIDMQSLEALSRKPKTRKTLKWILILAVVAVLVFLTPFGEGLKREIQFLLSGG